MQVYLSVHCSVKIQQVQGCGQFQQLHQFLPPSEPYTPSDIHSLIQHQVHAHPPSNDPSTIPERGHARTSCMVSYTFIIQTIT